VVAGAADGGRRVHHDVYHMPACQGGELPPPAVAAAATVAAAPPSLSLPGFAVDAVPPSDLGAALVGPGVRRSTGGRMMAAMPGQRGAVARFCPRGAFWHVVAQAARLPAPPTPGGAGWVLLSPAVRRAPFTGVTAGPRPGARRPRYSSGPTALGRA
jgi:hypothetical protein